MSAAAVRSRLLDAADRDAAADAWAAVEARLPHVPLMASWAWTATWLTHYGDAVAHRFLVANDDDGPCGVALLGHARVRRGPVPVRQLHVGTSGEPAGTGVVAEHQRVLAAPGREAAVHGALAEAAAADRDWDELVHAGATDAAAAAAVARATWRGRLRVERQPAIVHDLRAANAGEDVAAALPSGPRRRLRQTLRAFASRGPLALDWPDEPDAALAVLDELVALHQERWTRAGEPGAFASPRFRAFHRDLVTRLVPEGRAAVVRVRCGTETIGCLYGFVDGDALRFYQSGLAAFDDNRLRAGQAAHAVFMEACRGRGLALYDFLAGDQRYKRELSTGTIELAWCTVERPRLRLRGVELAREVRDRRGRRTAG